MLCQYGCKQESIYILKNGKHCCSVSQNSCPEVRRKNSSGLKKAYKEDRGCINRKNISVDARHRMSIVSKGKTKFTCEHLNRKSKTQRQNFLDGKWIGSFLNKKHTPEAKEKQRIAAIKIIEDQILNGERLTPSVGKNERQCLNELELMLGEKIDRQIQLNGYFVDGFVQSKKLIIEFDEDFHLRDDNIKRDQERQKYIEEKNNVSFFRIKEHDWLTNKKSIIQKFLLCSGGGMADTSIGVDRK